MIQAEREEPAETLQASPQSLSLARNPGIDLLRGLSILLVVLHHVGLRIPLKQGVLSTCLPKGLLSALIYNGYEAVFVFFVISGFLITSNSLARWGSLGAIQIRAFYARRAARIVPCLVFLVALLAVLHLAGAQDYVISHSNQSLPRAILSALGLHLNWYEGHTGYLPGNWDVLWSLSIEEVFYLAFPLACLGLPRRRFLVPALLLLAASLPLSHAALAGNPIWQEKAYLPGMAAIAAGVLGALVPVAPALRRPWMVPALAAAGALGVGAVLCFENVLWPWLGSGSLLLLTGSAVTLIYALRAQAGAGAPWTPRGSGWLRSFGRLSYEVYLTHMFVVWPVVRVFRGTGGVLRWGFLWYVPALGLSWLLGWLVAKVVSGPCERALLRVWPAAPGPGAGPSAPGCPREA